MIARNRFLLKIVALMLCLALGASGSRAAFPVWGSGSSHERPVAQTEFAGTRPISTAPTGDIKPPVIMAETLPLRHHTQPSPPLSAAAMVSSDLAAAYGYTISRPAPAGRETNAEIRPASTCTVSSAADSGAGALRQCLSTAGVGDTIVFDPAVFPPTAPVTISLQSMLPVIITDSLTLDASNAGVILDGGLLSSGSGLVVSGADGVRIRGLQIVRFPWDGIDLESGVTNTIIGGSRLAGSALLGQGNHISGNGRMGIWIVHAGTMSNTVQGNVIGADIVGAVADGNAHVGVIVSHGAANNLIGGEAADVGNLIGGNGGAGIQFQNVGTDSNQVLGNRIGTDAAGVTALPNYIGVLIGLGAAQNLISGNLISGNIYEGVRIESSGTENNRVLGNRIGVDATNAAALANDIGVTLAAGAANNVIGGSASGEGNLISGNQRDGICIQDAGTTGNQILGNRIGVNAQGTAALSNQRNGISIIWQAAGNIIGSSMSGTGDCGGPCNLISGNQEAGIWIADTDTSGNQVLGNYIGVDVAGAAALPNDMGVFIGFGATSNMIGGGLGDQGNLISGNKLEGIKIQDSGTTGNQVLGNRIGVDAAGMTALPNGNVGVAIITKATNNMVGGSTPGAGNLISGNQIAGISLENSGTTGNLVMGNMVGPNAAGAALGNQIDGIQICRGASGNVIGGSVPGEGNVIGGNDYNGLSILDPDTTGNRVLGNHIGVDAVGATALPNAQFGIMIALGASHNMIGGSDPGQGNLISGNGSAGIWLQNPGTANNQVLGNRIGTDIQGTAALPNHTGVIIGSDATENLVQDNLISGNYQVGIQIQDNGTNGNQVLGNRIGTDEAGVTAVPNYIGIVVGAQPAETVIGGRGAVESGCGGSCNLISGNTHAGLLITSGATQNQVLGNYVGVDINGLLSLGNGEFGIMIDDGAWQNNVDGNLVSGNGNIGIVIEDGGTISNTVTGNYIGVDRTGCAALGNGEHGVLVHLGAANNLIGGASPDKGNLISGNGESGISIENMGSRGNRVQGNSIGVSASGAQALGNGEFGVLIQDGAADNLIGGAATEEGNLISGNGRAGVCIEDAGTTGNRVQGNILGLDRSGSQPLGNLENGVRIQNGAANNLIGGSAPSEGNLIGSNGWSGIAIGAAGTDGNQVIGNWIGADASGARLLGNSYSGVYIGAGGRHNVIGPHNVIRFNAQAGVAVEDAQTLYNTITRNVIDRNGSRPIQLTNLPVPIAPLPPTLGGFNAGAGQVCGDTCPGCRVEIFANPTAGLAGTVFVGDVLAGADGHFCISLSGPLPHPFLAATATDPDGTTSEFAVVGFSVYLPLVIRQSL